jgi:ABC-type multidrug transport system permease subunit
VDRDRIVEVAAQLLAGVLFAVSFLGLVVAVQENEGIVSAVFAVYLTGLLLGGVLLDSIDARNWQLAFFGGVAVWGGYEYAISGDLFSLLLAVLGVVLVAANVLDVQ